MKLNLNKEKKLDGYLILLLLKHLFQLKIFQIVKISIQRKRLRYTYIQFL